MDSPDAKYQRAAYALAKRRMEVPPLKRPSNVVSYIKSTLPSATLPRTWDWREEAPGKINPPYDQMLTGACYLFGTLHAFSDRYAIFTNENYIHMSEIEIAAVARAFNINGGPSLDADNKSGKTDCIVCDPFNNGNAFLVIDAVGVYGTVAVGSKEDNPDYSFPAFCKKHNGNCSCPGDNWHGHRNYCDDDSDPNYQSDMSRALPSNIKGTYGGDVIFPIPSVRPLMRIMSVQGAWGLSFENIAAIIYTGGPVGIDFDFNGDFWRTNGGENWPETGGIYLCVDWRENGGNPFGYGGGRGGSGGHSVSAIGFGVQEVTFKFNGSLVTQDIKYLLCRNSWGADSPKAYFKAGWYQSVSGTPIMKNVWGSIGYAEFSEGRGYKCAVPGRPCQPAADGIYRTPEECAANCRAPGRRFRCVDRKFCREDPSGTFTDASICRDKCPLRKKGGGAGAVFLAAFVVAGGIAAVVLGWVVYKRAKQRK